MLLKIDLLPSWVKERSKVRAALVLGGLILAGVVVACVVIGGMYAAQIKQNQSLLVQKKAQADEVRKLLQELSVVSGQIAPIQEKVNFCHACENSGRQIAEKIQSIRKYIWNDIRLQSWSMSGAGVSMAGQLLTRDPARRMESETLARLLLNFNQCPDFVPGTATVNTPDWTGWQFPGSTQVGAGGQYGNVSFSMSATLRQPLAMPSYRAGGAAPAAAGPAGPGGGVPGPLGPAAPGARAGAPAPGAAPGGGAAAGRAEKKQ